MYVRQSGAGHWDAYRRHVRGRDVQPVHDVLCGTGHGRRLPSLLRPAGKRPFQMFHFAEYPALNVFLWSRTVTCLTCLARLLSSGEQVTGHQVVLGIDRISGHWCSSWSRYLHLKRCIKRELMRLHIIILPHARINKNANTINYK